MKMKLFCVLAVVIYFCHVVNARFVFTSPSKSSSDPPLKNKVQRAQGFLRFRSSATGESRSLNGAIQANYRDPSDSEAHETVSIPLVSVGGLEMLSHKDLRTSMNTSGYPTTSDDADLQKEINELSAKVADIRRQVNNALASEQPEGEQATGHAEREIMGAHNEEKAKVDIGRLSGKLGAEEEHAKEVSGAVDAAIGEEGDAAAQEKVDHAKAKRKEMENASKSIIEDADEEAEEVVANSPEIKEQLKSEGTEKMDNALEEEDEEEKMADEIAEERHGLERKKEEEHLAGEEQRIAEAAEEKTKATAEEIKREEAEQAAASEEPCEAESKPNVIPHFPPGTVAVPPLPAAEVGKHAQASESHEVHGHHEGSGPSPGSAEPEKAPEAPVETHAHAEKHEHPSQATPFQWVYLLIIFPCLFAVVLLSLVFTT